MKKSNKKNTILVSRFEVEQKLNTLIEKLSIKGVSAAGKYLLVRLKIQLGKILNDINAFRKDTIDSIKIPNNIDNLRAASEKENATEEVKTAFEEVRNKYNEKFAEIAIPYYNTILDILFVTLSEEDFDTLVLNNFFDTLGEYDYLYNKLISRT